MAIGTGSVANGGNGVGSQNGGNGGIALNVGIASGASGSTNGHGNAGNGGIAIGVGSVADGTSRTGNGNGHSRSVALDGASSFSWSVFSSAYTLQSLPVPLSLVRACLA
jgi:hypothetical protein